jgi:hypothetical protein
MIAEALKYLTGLATIAAAPVKIEDGDNRRIRHVINGEVIERDLPAPPRAHSVGCLADLIELANRFHAEESRLPVVWFDAAAVVLVIDDDGHRLEHATMKLEVSDAFAKLTELRTSKTWHEQKDFVRLLRIDLAGTLEQTVLLERVRKLKFENGVITSSEVGRQKESLGREITSRVEAGQGELPEEVLLSVPIYKTLGETERHPVRCSVEVDPPMGRLRLMPLPDEIERVRYMAIGSIEDRLEEGLKEGLPAYYGRPTA